MTVVKDESHPIKCTVKCTYIRFTLLVGASYFLIAETEQI